MPDTIATPYDFYLIKHENIMHLIFTLDLTETRQQEEIPRLSRARLALSASDWKQVVTPKSKTTQGSLPLHPAHHPEQLRLARKQYDSIIGDLLQVMGETHFSMTKGLQACSPKQASTLVDRKLRWWSWWTLRGGESRSQVVPRRAHVHPGRRHARGDRKRESRPEAGIADRNRDGIWPSAGLPERESTSQGSRSPFPGAASLWPDTRCLEEDVTRSRTRESTARF